MNRLAKDATSPDAVKISKIYKRGIMKTLIFIYMYKTEPIIYT